MRSSIKSSIKDSFIFGFGNVAVKIVGLILIPLYTNPEFFSADDFGIIGLIDITGLVLMSVFTSWLPQSLNRWYWAKENNLNRKQIFFMTFISQVMMSALFCIIFIPFSDRLSDMILRTTDWSLAISFIILSSALQGINNIINSLQRLQARSMLFMVSNICKLIIVLLLTIFFITHIKMGITGIYLAQVLGNFIIIIVLLPYSIRNSTLGFDAETWKSMMFYGLPLVLASVSTVLLNVIDRYALNSLVVLQYVALYTLAYKISSTLKLVVVDTIKLAIFPEMVRRIDSPENKIYYSKAMLYSSFIVMISIIGISLFSFEAIKILSGNIELWGAYSLVPVLSLSIYFTNMREVSVYGLIVKKKTSRVSIIIIVSMLLNLLLNFLFISKWNVYGAAAATFLSQLFYWALLHYIAQKTYFIPYENRKLLIIFLTGSLLSFAGLILNNTDLFPRLLLKLLLLASFPVILYFLDFYEKAEIEAIKGIARKWSDLRRLRENLNSVKNIKDDSFTD